MRINYRVIMGIRFSQASLFLSSKKTLNPSAKDAILTTQRVYFKFKF